MSGETLTAEQENERSARRELADALNGIRKHAKAYARKLEELTQGITEILEAIPADVSIDDLDLEEIGPSVSLAINVYDDCLYGENLKDELRILHRHLLEADGQIDYLDAGDFSE